MYFEVLIVFFFLKVGEYEKKKTIKIQEEIVIYQ